MSGRCLSRTSSGAPRSSSSRSTRTPPSGRCGNGPPRSAGAACSSRSGRAVTRRKASLDDLQATLGYFFTDLGLLESALTHVSAAQAGPAQSYQRLEFLGDRVLGLAVADLLFAAFPD